MKSLEIGKKYDYTSGKSVDSVYFREYDGIDTYHHTLCYVTDLSIAYEAIKLIDVDYYYINSKVYILKFLSKYEKLVWNTIINHVKEPIKIMLGDSQKINDHIFRVLIIEYNADLIMALKLTLPEPNYFIEEVWQ